MQPRDIRSFEDLEAYIKTFTTWDGDHVHDFAGACCLLGAVLDNLRIKSLEVDLPLIVEHLDESQLAFLRYICRLADQSRPAP
jgi:hypothetical protein